MQRYDWRTALMAMVTLAVVVAALLLPAQPQPLSYHAFADCRSALSIPNALNVLSNLPFVIAGAIGLRRVADAGQLVFHDPRERLPYLIFFLGALLTCFGSMYYHWAPDNLRLVWDRLPMTLAFSGLVSAVIAERLHARLGRWLLWPTLLLGGASVFFWYATERAGVGNLVPYALFQAWAILIVLFAAAAGAMKRYTHVGWLWWPVLLYGLAKIVEAFDLQVYRLSGTLLSGHSLKHLLAAAAVYAVVVMLTRRRTVASLNPAPNVV